MPLEASTTSLSGRARFRNCSTCVRYSFQRSIFSTRTWPCWMGLRRVVATMCLMSLSPVFSPTGRAFCPLILKPLYSGGLCEAVTWMPPQAPRWLMAKYTRGVSHMPMSTQLKPLASTPSIRWPAKLSLLGRMSRATTTRLALAWPRV